MRKGSSGSVRVSYPRLSHDQVVRPLEEGLPKLAERLPLVKAALFGSYAKGTFTVASDIDLLLVYAGPSRDDVYALAKRILGIPRLEVHAYSEAQYRNSRDVVRKMEEGGLVVFERDKEGR